MSNTKHTPLPWIADGAAVRREYDNTYFVADCDEPLGTPAMNEANAAFIVKAVNAHAELVEHATYLVERLADAHDPMREADITIHAAALRAALSRIPS